MNTSGQKPDVEVTIATRGSRLAVWQADFVKELLEHRGARVKRLIVKTTGDRVQDRFLHEIGGKGLFVKEIEEALARNEAQLAVHSLKDMPAKLPPPFKLATVLKRHSPADVMIFHPEVAARLDLPEGELSAETVASWGPLNVATGSLRRRSILKKVAPSIHSEGIRGNVDTRLEKLSRGLWDAMILAEASLDRLAIRDVVYRRLAPSWFIPCAGQGALAIETTEDSGLEPLLAPLECETTRRCVDLERSLLARLGGNCTMPFGCLARIETDGSLQVQAAIYNGDGQSAEATFRGPMDGDEESWLRVRDHLATLLRQNGAARILKDLKLPVPPFFEDH